MENISQAEKQMLKDQQATKEKETAENEANKKQRARTTKKVIYWVLGIVIVFGGLGFLISKIDFKTVEPTVIGNVNFPTGPIHWHADLTASVCGVNRELPKPVGNAHLGTVQLHTHEDGRIHIEASVNSPDEIKLFRYLKNIGIKVAEDSVFDVKNGDDCNGNPGKWVLTANGIEEEDFYNHVILDGQRLSLDFK
ncbi:MAG: hypothetical protein HYS32_03610 [Candidatus Woesearchaeota archaeon]|nr:MAG: hypothetical protein HYS32_03610 [Candidatus Woesearchaeota archaeon]